MKTKDVSRCSEVMIYECKIFLGKIMYSLYLYLMLYAYFIYL